MDDITFEVIKDSYLNGRFKELNPLGESALLVLCAKTKRRD